MGGGASAASYFSLLHIALTKSLEVSWEAVWGHKGNPAIATLAISYIVHDDTYYLAQSIQSFSSAGQVFVFVSRVPWHNVAGNWEHTAELAKEVGAEVVLGDWNSELSHRQVARDHLLEQGYTHALIPDGDEIIEPQLLDSLVKIATTELAERVYCHWDTYWMSPEYVIRPREAFTPLILCDLRQAVPVNGRNYEGGRPLLLTPQHGLIHHLSYVGPDTRIQRKISTWGHALEVVPEWYSRVWLAWEQDHALPNLHPTHPNAYGFAERIPVPELLQPTLERYRELTGKRACPALELPKRGAKVSIIIPLYGGEEDIQACLESLQTCNDLLHEVIVVDNASPDNAALIASKDNGVTLIRNSENLGFARACNQGAEQASGDVLLFLNSDTIVSRYGLVRLIETLLQSGSVGAAGPYSNHVGHFQKVEVTYTSLTTLPLFAEDFAYRSVEDVETDMLVGFCLAVRRSVWEEVGGFDERFGIGTFEDNDLCYRIRRAGYRLLISGRSFVYHRGSQTFARLETDMQSLMNVNASRFQRKWRLDLESGYASHLSGMAPSRIHFEPDKHPERRIRQTLERVRQARISLCIIGKNEERVVRDCLESAKPFFFEIIFVDTGSSDRTVEIAEEVGAKVYHFPWVDSFSLARNESLKYATGNWIFWMDCDDTLPFESGEALLQCALNAPPNVTAFVVPVQFVEEGVGQGTRVDHVKLIRRSPNLAFEGRIHEQILPSIRVAGGEIVRSSAYVLHSGYDSSPEGQAKKRERDIKLLHLDIAERPDHPFVLFNLGMTYHYMGEHPQAIDWLRKCLSASPVNDSHVRKAYALLAVSLREVGERAEALQVLEEGLSQIPDDPELHFHTGIMLSGEGRNREAKEHYLKTLSSDISSHFSSVDMGILSYKTFHNLGVICMELGDYSEAQVWWRKALDSSPHPVPIALHLGQVALEHSDLATAREMMQRVEELEGRSEGWVILQKEYGKAIGGEEAALQLLERLTNASPQSIPPRLVYARTLLEMGRIQEALPHLRQLDLWNVPEATYFLGVNSIRCGRFEEALAYMERASQLNPHHKESQEQASHLRRMLSIQQLPEAIPLEDALECVATYFSLDVEELKRYVVEDTIGGYNLADAGSPNPFWHGGCVWEVEGQVLYALVRALKPKVIVEIGSLTGCSTSHLALACERNGEGIVYAIDPALDFSRVPASLLTRIIPVKQDAFTWVPPLAIDFLFEDGAHTKGFTGSILRRLLPYCSRPSAILCHDAYTPHLSGHLFSEFEEALGGDAQRILIHPSNCGLGYSLYGDAPD